MIGAAAKLLMPGPDPGGWFLTILLGIAGAWVGGLLAGVLGLTGVVPGLIAGMLSAMLLLLVYRLVKRRPALYRPQSTRRPSESSCSPPWGSGRHSFR